MKIFDEINISWDGLNHAIKPTYEVLARIESTSGLSLMNLSIRSFKQDLPLTAAAELYSKLLSQAGVDVSPSEVYEKVDITEIVGAANSLINSCLPDQSGGGKAKKGVDEKKP